MKKDDKMKSKVILILIAILLIIIILLFNILNNIKEKSKDNRNILSMDNNVEHKYENFSYLNNSNSEEQYEEDNYHYEETELPNQEEIIEATKDIVYIQNMGEIFKIYKSDMPIIKISVKIEDLIMNIFNKSITDKNSLEIFYNTNKEKIEQRTYVKSYIQFQNLLNKIFTNNSTKIIESKIKIESAHRKNDNTIMATIELTLDNSDVVLLTLEINEITSEIKIS